MWFARLSLYRLLTLAMAARSVSLIQLAAVVSLSKGRVVELSCKSRFEVVFSLSSQCFRLRRLSIVVHTSLLSFWFGD